MIASWQLHSVFDPVAGFLDIQVGLVLTVPFAQTTPKAFTIGVTTRRQFFDQTDLPVIVIARFTQQADPLRVCQFRLVVPYQ